MRSLSLALLALASVGFAQNATTLTSAGGTFTIYAGSYTGAATGLGGLADFFCNGVTGSYAFRDMWAYRIAGDSREYMVKSNNATFSNTTNTWDAQMFKGQNGSDSNPLIQIDVHYSLFANGPTSPILNKCVQITNLTTTNLQYSLIHYMDYDVPGNTGDTFTTHTYTGNTDLIRQGDTGNPGNYMETFYGATNTLNIQHGPLYSNLFTNNSIDFLNGSVDPGVGDFAVGFQMSGDLAPGQQSTCPGCYTALNGSTPEPGTIAALVFGVAGLPFFRARKKK